MKRHFLVAGVVVVALAMLAWFLVRPRGPSHAPSVAQAPVDAGVDAAARRSAIEALLRGNGTSNLLGAPGSESTSLSDVFRGGIPDGGLNRVGGVGVGEVGPAARGSTAAPVAVGIGAAAPADVAPTGGAGVGAARSADAARTVSFGAVDAGVRPSRR